MAPGLVVSYEHFHHLCPHYVTTRVVTFCDQLGGCKSPLLKDPTAIQRFNGVAGRGSILLPAKLLFYSSWALHGQIEGLDASFFRNLFFAPRIRRAATAFIEQTFGDREFAAVHLRSLEGSCKRRTNSKSPGAARFVCAPPRPTFLRLMNEVTNLSVAMPIFVASDRQDRGALKSYVEAGDKMFSGVCRGDDCAFIDFEIATQASFFLGTYASTIAGGLISKWRWFRRLRAGEHYFPSVIDYREKEASLLGKLHIGTSGLRLWRL
jgi:hypothetical protein